MNENININILARQIYAKCDCCRRVQDIYYQVNIKKINTNLIQGSLNMCKACGDNLNEILRNENEIGDTIIKKFEFKK